MADEQVQAGCGCGGMCSPNHWVSPYLYNGMGDASGRQEMES